MLLGVVISAVLLRALPPQPDATPDVPPGTEATIKVEPTPAAPKPDASLYRLNEIGDGLFRITREPAK